MFGHRAVGSSVPAARDVFGWCKWLLPQERLGQNGVLGEWQARGLLFLLLVPRLVQHLHPGCQDRRVFDGPSYTYAQQTRSLTLIVVAGHQSSRRALRRGYFVDEPIMCIQTCIVHQSCCSARVPRVLRCCMRCVRQSCHAISNLR